MGSPHTKRFFRSSKTPRKGSFVLFDTMNSNEVLYLDMVERKTSPEVLQQLREFHVAIVDCELGPETIDIIKQSQTIVPTGEHLEVSSHDGSDPGLVYIPHENKRTGDMFDLRDYDEMTQG